MAARKKVLLKVIILGDSGYVKLLIPSEDLFSFSFFVSQTKLWLGERARHHARRHTSVPV